MRTFSSFNKLARLRIVNTVSGFSIDDFKITATGAIPEPATWALMITGFGLVGASLRRHRRVSTATV